MKTSYSIDELAEDIKILQPNKDAMDNLMGSLEFSGVFSNKLMTKIFALSALALECRSNFVRGYVTETESNDKIRLYCDEFEMLLSVYNIFSQEYSAHLWGLFHTICYYSPSQK